MTPAPGTLGSVVATGATPKGEPWRRSRSPDCASRSATRSCSTASTSTSEDGTTFALLGPNGAGKTTAVQILSTLIGFDGGQARVAGTTCPRIPTRCAAAIGVTGQFSAVDNLLTGAENLALMADLHHLGRAEGRRRAAELLDRFDLGEAAERSWRRPTPAACGAAWTWP